MTVHSPIRATTRIAGIFGDPVEHSRSPQMHNAAFAALKLNCRYVAFRVRPEELRRATQSIRSLQLIGVNVTVPHKEKILPHLDECTPLASTLGAVNTVINRDGTLIGDNTDVAGFVGSLRGKRLRGHRAIVIGAGGAARAVLYGLRELGIEHVALANRTPARSRALLKKLGASAPRTGVVGLDALADARTFERVRLVVNATSLGWHGESFPSIAAKASSTRCMFYDMSYGHQTNFLDVARAAKRSSMDGAEMLILQGAMSFKLWTGRRAPVAAMRTAFNKKYRIDS